jgi:hypothetical protein
VNTLTLTKFEAAERQLIQAIRLFFEEGDPISIHTLAEAAVQVFRDLALKYDTSSCITEHPSLSHISKSVIYNTMNEARNFFKHAGKDPDKVLEFDVTRNNISLLECSTLHTSIKGEVIPEVLAFELWFLSRNKDLFASNKEFMEKLTSSGALSKQWNFSDCSELISELRESKSIQGVGLKYGL